MSFGTKNHLLSRRRVLSQLLVAGSAWAAPAGWAQSGMAAPRDGRLIMVFLRGAYDGLSALVPYADPRYRQLRPNIAIAAPDGSAQSSIALDDTFALHPALSPLFPLWQQGVLSVLPAAGSPEPTRSHVDAQHQWELGSPRKGGGTQGWMNQWANQITQSGTRGAGTEKPNALAVGESNPFILAGPAPVQRVPRGQAATQKGALGNDRTREAMLHLYQGDDELSQAFRAGAQSRAQTAQILSENEMASMVGDRQEMMAANNGAPSAKGLLLDAQYLGTLMRRDRSLRIGFLSAGGWDTHANQGAAQGQLANNLPSLASALVQLRKDFSQPNDVVMVCSEFGRTSAENGTRGTDHGHGNALWLMGNKVQGGRWHGQWTGLDQGNLHEGRDLPVHHDFRAVFAQVMQRTQGLSGADLDALFPGLVWDRALDKLMKS
jgi:uncharacterized protein (DUF1501 family)